MNKRQNKKNKAKKINELELLGLRLQSLRDLGVFGLMSNASDLEFIDCNMKYKDLIKIPSFQRDKLLFDKDWSREMVEISFLVGELKFFCLMNKDLFAKKFPEECELGKDYIEVDGTRYYKGGI